MKIRLLIVMFFVLAVPLCSFAMTAKPLVFVVHPFLSALELHERFQPLVDELSVRIGHEVVLQVSKDYPTHVDTLCSGRADIAFLGPSIYVNAFDRNPDIKLLGVLNGRVPMLRGVIVVRADSPLKNLSNLNRHSIAFVSRESTMGFKLACAELHKVGISLESLSSYAFLGNHENVVFSVLAGKFDAGSVKYEAYEKMSTKGLRILAVQPKVADHAFVASSSLEEEVALKIKEVLLHLNDTKAGRKILHKLRSDAVAIRPVHNEDYDPLRLCTDCFNQINVDDNEE